MSEEEAKRLGAVRKAAVELLAAHEKGRIIHKTRGRSKAEQDAHAAAMRLAWGNLKAALGRAAP